MQTRRIGIVGLGLVGSAIGARLRVAGWTTVGFDLRASACDEFRRAGGDVASSLHELGRNVDCVVLAVFDSKDVVSVLDAEDALLSTGHQVHTVIDCSTGDPEILEPLATQLKARGVEFIEAPLSGSSQQIAAGEATLLLGGEAEAIARCDALLKAIASERIHVGAAGMGAKAKLATNLVLGLNRAALAEGMVFAESMGIAPERFLQLVLATPARSDAALIKGPLMVREDFAPQSRIRQHLKDVELMLASARGNGVTLPFSEVHARLMQAAVAAGDGDLDNAAVLKQLRRGTGEHKQDKDR
jgi:3-hydroxyisobutyrate dehydrogenase-like beta-hydroxyacid dehydrogenase